METNGFVEVALDGVRVGFPVQEIDRIVRAVEIARVPGAAPCLLGVIDVGGEIVPVYELRRLLGLPSRELRTSDRILLTRGRARRGFVVDEVLGGVESDRVELPDSFAMRASGLRGVVRRDDGLLLLHDLERLMAAERAIPVQADAGT